MFILVLDTRAIKPDVTETTDQRLANGNRNTDRRLLIDPRLHRRQRRVMGPRTSREATVVFCDTVPTRRRQVREICRLSLTLSYAYIKTCMHRSANGETRETLPTIGDADHGKSTECCHVDNYVLRCIEQHSHVIIHVGERGAKRRYERKPWPTSQIVRYKTMFMCVHVCLFAWFFFVFLCETISPSV